MKTWVLFIFSCTFFLVGSSRFSWGQTSQNIPWVDSTLSHMTLDQKIGQLFMIAAYSNQSEAYEADIEKQIRKYQVGGLIFFQGDPARQLQLTNRYQ